MIVDLTLTEEQRLIEDSLGALLADTLPVERLRDPASHGGAAERALIGAFAGFGLFGMGLSVEEGGLGLGAAEQVLCAGILGRHLASPACIAQMAAPHLATDANRQAALVAGTSRAAFANRIDGETVHIVDGEGATHWLLLAEGVALHPAGDGPLPVPILDETVAVGRAAWQADWPGHDAAADRLALLLSAYLAGLSAAVLDTAVAYARTREQFGQPIGAFQAVKHQCADMAVRSAAAEAQVRYAATIFGRGKDDRAEASAAWMLATRAAIDNAKAAIQIHGAMGFTAECDMHLFLKRAHLVATLGPGLGSGHRSLLEMAAGN